MHNLEYLSVEYAKCSGWALSNSEPLRCRLPNNIWVYASTIHSYSDVILGLVTGLLCEANVCLQKPPDMNGWQAYIIGKGVLTVAAFSDFSTPQDAYKVCVLRSAIALKRVEQNTFGHAETDLVETAYMEKWGRKP